MKKKILVFINYYGKTSETFISDEIEFLRSQENLEVEILHYGSEIPEKNVNGLNMPSSPLQRWKQQIKHFNLQKLRSLKYRNGQNASLEYLIDFFKKNQYDTIYCHFGTNGKLIAELKALGVISKETKLVVRFHGLDMNFKKYPIGYYDTLINYSAIVLFGTKIAHDKLLRYGFNKLINLPVGIKNQNIVSSENLKENKRDNFKILSIGRFIELKGHKISVDIISNLSQENVSLEIIGDGPLMEEIKKAIENRNLQNRIILHGAKPHEFVFKKLEEAQIYIYTGIYDSEGRCENQATSVLEAMAKGKIVVASNLGGIPDYLIENKTGFLSEPGNIDEFVKKLEFIIDNWVTEEIKQIRINAVEMIRKNYAQENLNQKLLSILLE